MRHKTEINDIKGNSLEVLSKLIASLLSENGLDSFYNHHVSIINKILKTISKNLVAF